MASDAVHGGVVAVAAGVPGADGVEAAVDIGPGGTGAGIAGEGSPVGVDAADEVDVAVFGIVFKEVDQVGGLGCGPGAVFEAEAPEEEDGFAVLVEVAGIFADVDGVAEEFPIVHYQGGGCARGNGKVEHHGPDAALKVAGHADTREDRVDVAEARGAGGFADEAGEEEAVDAVLAHPF